MHKILLIGIFTELYSVVVLQIAGFYRTQFCFWCYFPNNIRFAVCCSGGRYYCRFQNRTINGRLLIIEPIFRRL